MGRKTRRLAVIDCETDPFKYGRTPKPFVWGYYDGETFLYFWGDTAQECCDELLDYLKDETDLVIYAHNGGKFDFFYLLKHLDPEVMIINGRIARAHINDGAIQLRDSYLILPLPLSAHDKDEIDYSKMERENRNLHKQEIIRYLRKDCESLYDWVKNFRDNFGTGLTLAGTAFKQLKETGYPMENTHMGFDDTLRPFYMGGRVQCFEVGQFIGDRKYVDINSAYPYAMTFKHWQGGVYRETLKIPDRENGSYFVKLDAISYGALPYKDGNKTYYPDDNKVRTYYASGWEIIAGLKTGTIKIKKVYRCYIPTFTHDFKAYVDKFFSMKLQAERDRDDAIARGDHKAVIYYKSIREFAKLMLNSCYGKFGQDGRNFEKFMLLEYGDVPEPYIDKEGKVKRWGAYAEAHNLMSVFNRPDPVDRFYNVATAASVTGFVRAYLWENIHASKGVLYCDTDSLICSEFGGEISDKLGAWKLEANISEAYIAQRKMYALRVNPVGEYGPIDQTKKACKGVKLTYEQIRQGVISGENIEHIRDAPAFSLKFGARFTAREVDFKNIAKNACNNPPDDDNSKTGRKKRSEKTVTYSLREVLCL